MRYFISSFRAAAAWIGPRSKPFDLVRIYAIGAVIAFFFLYFGNFWVEPGSFDYVKVARAITGAIDFNGQPPQGAWGRDIGMALIWLISGYPLTDSLTGVVIIQVLMGLAMPLLCYLALHPWFPRASYYIAIAATVSLSPVLMAKTIHHDQPYIFFTLVSLYFINRYMLTKLPRYLYALTASVFGLGLIRQAGYGLFWPLMPVCGLSGGRKSYKHIALAAMLFIGASMAYSHYRTSLMGELGVPGVALFQNIYVNSSEFGVKLSPDMGPNVALILSRVHECSLPSPAQSKYLRDWPGPAVFKTENFDRYTADELVDRIATQSNLAYYDFILKCVGGKHNYGVLGRILLRATFEIAEAHPLFILKLFLRNSLELLYDPGWLHNPFMTGPQFKGGLLFQFGDYTTAKQGGTIGDRRFPERALSEAGFIPLERQYGFIIDVHYAVYSAWYGYYQPVTIVVGCLAWVVWISTAIGLLQSTLGGPRLTRWSELLLSDRVLPASIGISVLLLVNVAITAIGEEPIYRYDFSLLMLKIMLGGIGATVVIELLVGLKKILPPSNRIPNPA